MMSDTNELRAAAERLRTNADAEYAKMSPLLYFADCETLANGYLAEHPADDGEPVAGDTEWMKAAIGWIPVDGGRDGYIGRDKIIFCKGSENIYSAWLQVSQHYYDMRRIVRVYTRGDVRRLCRALGITLKEGAA